MGDDKTKWSNVIIGPWESSEKLQKSRPLKGGKTREQIVEDLLRYLENELKLGTKVNHIMRHTVGLYHGQVGSKNWKRYLSDNMMARDSDFQKAKHIMTIVQNNEKVNQVTK